MVFSFLFRGLLNILRLPFFPLWLIARLLGRPRAAWLRVRIRRQLVELPDTRRNRLARFFPSLRRNLPTPLQALRQLSRFAGADPRIRGIVFTIPPLAVGWATAQSLRDVLVGLRQAGKRVVVHLPEGGGHKELFVASAADTIVAAPQAPLLALGLGLQTHYFKKLLDRMGVKVERFARAEFKTAAEGLARETMSEPQREQLDALLTTFDRELRSGLAERQMDESGVDALFAAGFLRGEEAVKHGAVDALLYEDELAHYVAPEAAKPRLHGAARYLGFHRNRFFRRMRTPPHVAVIAIHGAIMPGRKAEQAVAALRIARKNKRIRGVLLHIDSPGGSATTSDQIHREVIRLKESKPVVAYFGNVAASGGYYVSAGANAIVAQPTTITGSIGVVSVRFVAEELLDRIGIGTEVIRKAPHADMFSPARDLDADERAILEREMEGFYREFVALVAKGRGRDAAEIEPLARGRVWSGRDAHAHGLVDQLGGFHDALVSLRGQIAGGGSLEPLALVPKNVDVPADPSPPPTRASLAILGALQPELADLMSVATQTDRVLLFDPMIPRVS